MEGPPQAADSPYYGRPRFECQDHYGACSGAGSCAKDLFRLYPQVFPRKEIPQGCLCVLHSVIFGPFNILFLDIEPQAVVDGGGNVAKGCEVAAPCALALLFLVPKEERAPVEHKKKRPGSTGISFRNVDIHIQGQLPLFPQF